MSHSKVNQTTRDIIFVFNEHKLLILQNLYDCKDDVCGCDLIDKLKIRKDLLSYHIKSLRDRGFIEEIKCGVKKKYSITKNKNEIVKNILTTAKLI